MSADAFRRAIPGAQAVAVLGRRARGAFEIDEWGLDPEFVSLVDPFLAARWDIEVTGASLPAVGAAVLVCNQRFGISEPWVLARGVRRATNRFVRTVGVPDVAGAGPLFRRFGGVLDRTDEVAGLLDAGHLVGVPLAREVRSRDRAGVADVDRLGAALASGAPVVPVALVGREFGRSWRVVIGTPLDVPATGGSLAAADLAEAARHAVQDLLDDALPASWWF